MTQYSFCFTYRISNFLNFHQEISFLKKCAWVPQNVNHSFQILTLTLSHPPPTNTSLGVWIWTSAHSYRERGWIQDYPIFTRHDASAVNFNRLNLLNLQVCNYRWECSRCRIRVRATHRSWFTWSSSWRNVAGSSRRMIRDFGRHIEGINRPFPSATRIWQIFGVLCASVVVADAPPGREKSVNHVPVSRFP